MPMTMKLPKTPPRGSAPTGRPLDLDESVAGEEDPGAAIDLTASLPAGTPATGEDVCPRCGGSGRLGAGECQKCQGSGVVNVGIGGA
jgi:hypothetical protein